MSGYIDIAAWPRRELADFFGSCDYPFYSLCCRHDAEALHRYAGRDGLSFYLCTVWSVVSALNAVDAFHYKLRAEGVYRHDYLSPSFTDGSPDGLLKIVTLDWAPGESMVDFARRARAASDAQTALFPPAASEKRDDLVYLTCLPWLDFTSLDNERSFDKNDSVPRIGWGRLSHDGTMPVSVDVNHRLIDGRHIAEFFSALSSFTSR